ncbi:hypothetical protein C3K01_26720 [Klebsiella pneumoniae subsp. pneumoniae]|nr:hypothetical protein C3K01_26720 [Klebsiella pneumoniae subsp. pneumoniae]PZA98874.1 hypothetical protein C3J99_27200 [Klebsiella pneumoniae subsp. pneumoniae]PZB60836.1 hypothetical protein C3K00_27140 [Klebsiella pneumoniae subsp. pneumoniae]HBY5804699.1 hypothetical protein [Klebsiella pneumoniae]HBY5805104.1 hypothetical protein [Klebsiella pneumoniae]
MAGRHAADHPPKKFHNAEWRNFLGFPLTPPIPLQRFPVLAKTDPLAEFRPPADGGGPKADDDFAGIY